MAPNIDSLCPGRGQARVARAGEGSRHALWSITLPRLTLSVLARSLSPLFFERVDEILPAQRANDLQRIVEHFEQNVVAAANAVKDDANLVSRALSMRISGSAGGVRADRADLLERTIGLIQTVLALDYQGIRERQVSMEENALLRVEFEDKIDDLILLIDIEHGEYEMLEVPKFLPPDIAIIQSERRPITGKRSCHALVLRLEPHLRRGQNHHWRCRIISS